MNKKVLYAIGPKYNDDNDPNNYSGFSKFEDLKKNISKPDPKLPFFIVEITEQLPKELLKNDLNDISKDSLFIIQIKPFYLKLFKSWDLKNLKKDLDISQICKDVKFEEIFSTIAITFLIGMYCHVNKILIQSISFPLNNINLYVLNKKTFKLLFGPQIESNIFELLNNNNNNRENSKNKFEKRKNNEDNNYLNNDNSKIFNKSDNYRNNDENPKRFNRNNEQNDENPKWFNRNNEQNDENPKRFDRNNFHENKEQNDEENPRNNYKRNYNQKDEEDEENTFKRNKDQYYKKEYNKKPNLVTKIIPPPQLSIRRFISLDQFSSVFINPNSFPTNSFLISFLDCLWKRPIESDKFYFLNALFSFSIDPSNDQDFLNSYNQFSTNLLLNQIKRSLGKNTISEFNSYLFPYGFKCKILSFNSHLITKFYYLIIIHGVFLGNKNIVYKFDRTLIIIKINSNYFITNDNLLIKNL